MDSVDVSMTIALQVQLSNRKLLGKFKIVKLCQTSKLASKLAANPAVIEQQQLLQSTLTQLLKRNVQVSTQVSKVVLKLSVNIYF